MARWIITRSKGDPRVRLSYLNQVTGKTWDCGYIESSYEDSVLVEWIIEHGSPAPRDLVVLSDGTMLRFRSGRLRLEETRLGDGRLVSGWQRVAA